MVTSTLEKPQNKKSFTDLMHLREELTKEAKNQERLVKFQKTIDKELEKGERKGIIEFSESEWKSLITDENLPPLKEVQKLLKEKIASAKEVASETKEKTGGIMEELQKKAQNLTEGAKKKVEELAAKAEGLKKYSKPVLWFLGIGLSLKIWGYKIANWFSGLFGKKGEYDEKIKLAEMEKDFLKNPEEAVKKYGEEALEKVKEKGDEKTDEGAKEGKEGVLEKVGPLAALGVAGAGILTLIKGKLPEGMQKSLSGLDEKSLLGKLARNRALRLFGVGGVALFGIGKLYEYIENNSATLGDIPTDTEGKKSWWKNALEKAGIGAKEGSEEIWAVLNGSKLEDYFEHQTPKDGYVFLQDHKTIQGAKREVLAFEKRCERIYSEYQDAFNAAGAFGLILKPGMFVGSALKGTATMLSLLKFASPGLIIPAGLIVGLTNNSIEGMQHIQVPEDIGPEDIHDMLGIGDISEFLKTHMGDLPDDIDFDTVAQEFKTLEQKIKDFNSEAFMKKILGGAAEKLIQTEQEKINSVNEGGIETLIKDLEYIEIKSDKKGKYEKLLGTKEAPGILRKVYAKVKAGEAIKESDIRELMEASEGTNIRIFPRDESRAGTTIQYVLTDDHGTVQGLPKNICINPTLDQANQYEAARDFVINEYDLGALNVLGKVGSEFRGTLSELSEMIKTNNENSGTLIESLFRNGWSFATFGLETYAVDYLGNKYFIGPWNLVESAFLNLKKPEDRLEMQEGLVEYGQGLAPVFVITAIKNAATGHGLSGVRKRGLWNMMFKNTLVQSVTYPVHFIKSTAKGGYLSLKYIFQRALSGNYQDIFSDPKNEIKARFYEVKHRLQSLQKFGFTNELRKIGGLHSKMAKLEEARKLLYSAKQRNFTRGAQITEALHILESSGSHLQHASVDDLLDDTRLKKKIAELESEIEEQKNKIRYLEKGIREKFPQELKNRQYIVDTHRNRVDITTEQGKKDAKDAFEKSKQEIEDMENKRIAVEKDLIEAGKKYKANPSDVALKNDHESKKRAHANMMSNYNDKHRYLSEIREAMGELLHGRKPKIKLGDSHLRSIKGLRGSAKVLGILAVTVGAGFGIEKVAEYMHGDSHEEKNESTEESDADDDMFYGFRKSNESDSKEKNDDTCETPEEFNRRIEAIETQYTESISKFLDPEWVQNVSEEEKERRIQEAADGHMLRVDALKSLIRTNKGMMESFWNKHFTSEGSGEEIVPKDIREQGVKAFMFIHRKDGKLTLDYMNHQDIKNVFYILYDQNYKNWAEKNLGSGVATAGELALRVAPFTGSYMDGQDAWKSFSRGNIGDGMWSTAWCIGGLLLDVGGVVSFGGTTAAGTGLRAAKVGTKAATAVLHNGVQMGVQFGQSLAKIPRSESINIDKL